MADCTQKPLDVRLLWRKGGNNKMHCLSYGPRYVAMRVRQEMTTTIETIFTYFPFSLSALQTQRCYNLCVVCAIVPCCLG